MEAVTAGKELHMKIGVIGGGRVGSALAATWQERGHEVVVSTRDTIAETSAASDVVVLAVPASAAPDVLAKDAARSCTALGAAEGDRLSLHSVL